MPQEKLTKSLLNNECRNEIYVFYENGEVLIKLSRSDFGKGYLDRTIMIVNTWNWKNLLKNNMELGN